MGSVLKGLVRALVLAFTAGTFSCRTPVGPYPSDTQAEFHDDFDSVVLEGGWVYRGNDAGRFSLSERTGFARIMGQDRPGDSEIVEHSRLVRDVSGDFILIARLEYAPAADREIAGLVVEGSDGRTVIFGLISATGARGTFQGALALAERGGGQDEDFAVFEYSAAEAYLRLERRGNDFLVFISEDGEAYVSAGMVKTSLSDDVQVGIGVAGSDNCNRDCDEHAPADFDFFEIARVVG